MARDGKKTKYIMVQGTMSGAGKSLIVAGLLRVFAKDGFRAAPFKSQNMALNSYVTAEGLEMGRAQVMQAEAAGIKPTVSMNPILLKPVDDVGSQVIINGHPIGNMKAAEYFEYKKSLVPVIKDAIGKLSDEYDIIVIEGAGSPAEINLKENDIVNMGMAAMVDAPVLLVGDIDRGGVFAQLYGTTELLEAGEKKRIRGLLINKFRGDKGLLVSGVQMIEEKTDIPVVGVLPFIDIRIDDEDSMSIAGNGAVDAAVDIAVIRLPHISNYTDINVFMEYEGVGVRFVDTVSDLGSPDMIIIPGTKSTIADTKWLKEAGFFDEIRRFSDAGGTLFGICGGYQMLGNLIEDPDFAETGGTAEGLGLLPLYTTLSKDKVTRQVTGHFGKVSGILQALSGMAYTGYEIHMGKSAVQDACEPFTDDESGVCGGNVFGTYVHGIFDDGEIATVILKAIAKDENKIRRGGVRSHAAYKERQYDILADMIRKNSDMDKIYEIAGIKR